MMIPVICIHLQHGGFKDITRIASSSPMMWQNICEQNKEEILKGLLEFQDLLNHFENQLKSNDQEFVLDYFDHAKKYRDSFSHVVKSSNYFITVNVKDIPGVIAEVSTILSLSNINIKNIGIENNREFSNGVLKILFQNQEDKEKSIALLKNRGYEVFPD